MHTSTATAGFAKRPLRILNLVAVLTLAVSVGAWLLCSDVARADNAADAVIGNWLTESRDGIIEITRHGDYFEGRIVGGNQPGRLDSHNPDPAKRQYVLRGQVIIHDMRYEGEGEWASGTIYDPAGGSTYRCKWELRADGTLKVRGYLGVSLFGKSQIWTRYTGTSMDLPRAD